MNYLAFKLRIIRDFVQTSFKLAKPFPNIKFETKTIAATASNESKITLRSIKAVYEQLIKKGLLDDALLIRMLYLLGAKPAQLVLMKFEDFAYNKDLNSAFISLIGFQDKRKLLNIPNDVYELVIRLKGNI